jgi:hypothetical protein
MEADIDGRGGGAEVLISHLSGEILHSILLRLPSTAAVVRTSLISSRWRRVWTHIPELVLGSYGPAPTQPPPYGSSRSPEWSGETNIPAHLVAPWLSFASHRLAGILEHSLSHRDDDWWEEEMEEILLPICERATGIKPFLASSFVLRLPPTGSFTALIKLSIMCAALDGSELGHVVSSQCPCIQTLVVVVRLLRAFEVSICSESLKKLYFANNTKKLEVTAPRLAMISVARADEAYIFAPNLQNVTWRDDPYDPNRHQFVAAGRHIQFLRIKELSTKLMQRFDTVDELTLDLSIPPACL